MRALFHLSSVSAWILTIGLAFADNGRSQPFPRSSPEAHGVSSIELLDFIEAADDEIESLHSIMILRHGQVIAEGWWAPYHPELNHMLYSLSKSFTSTAVGIAVSEGRLSIDEPVLSFFPEDAPPQPGNNLKAMRVRDLLTMSTGHETEPSSAADIVSARTFLAAPVPHLPGTHFKYNTAATFMLSAIVQQRTGQTVLDYLRPRLFEPLGIDQPVWDTNRQGISLGGYGLRVRTEDIAKLGQLYLQRGEWEGRILIPGDWVDLATSRQVSNGSNPISDWNQGYGFQFWRCRHHAYRGDGAFGQYCLVLPEQNAVVAITSGVGNMQGVLNLIWTKLLPTFRPVPIPADPTGHGRLQQRLATLQIPTVEGAKTSLRAKELLGRKFRFEPNNLNLESLTLIQGDDSESMRLELQVDGTVNRFPCGYGVWKMGQGSIGSLTDEPVAASLAWADDNNCVIKLCAYETPYCFTLRLQLEENALVVEGGSNVAFGPRDWPKLTAKVE